VLRYRFACAAAKAANILTRGSGRSLAKMEQLRASDVALCPSAGSMPMAAPRILSTAIS
jgi:hypothetical protein